MAVSALIQLLRLLLLPLPLPRVSPLTKSEVALENTSGPYTK